MDGDTGGVRRSRACFARRCLAKLSARLEAELQSELDLVVFREHTVDELAGQSCEAGVLDAQSERGVMS